MLDRHADIERLIDDYVDGALDDLRARAVRGHLRACDDCSAKVEATQNLVEISGSMPALDAPDSLWGRIAADLDADDERLAGRGRLFWFMQSIGRRLLFGGGALAVAGLLVGIIVLHDRKPLAPALQAVRLAPSPEAIYQDALREVERADDDFQVAIGDLRTIAKTERDRWAPEVRRAFDTNLAIIDAAVANQAELARRNPGDVAVADTLAETYRKEIDFLQSAVVRGGLN
jgi:anti-sigma factor RsiW